MLLVVVRVCRPGFAKLRFMLFSGGICIITWTKIPLAALIFFAH
jgi:hypothetical protein